MASYYKGYVRRPDKDHLILLSYRTHQTHLKQLQAVPQPPQWDSRSFCQKSATIPPLPGPCTDKSGMARCPRNVPLFPHSDHGADMPDRSELGP
jgi:hypothetical protein